jgi:hypothetical protein
MHFETPILSAKSDCFLVKFGLGAVIGPSIFFIFFRQEDGQSGAPHETHTYLRLIKKVTFGLGSSHFHRKVLIK